MLVLRIHALIQLDWSVIIILDWRNIIVAILRLGILLYKNLLFLFVQLTDPLFQISIENSTFLLGLARRLWCIITQLGLCLCHLAPTTNVGL